MVLLDDDETIEGGVPSPAAVPQGQSQSVSPVSYDDTVWTIGVLPGLLPRPISTNIHTLTIYLCDRITSIPSYQLLEYGYMGIVEERAVYALTGAPPWVDYQDPGAARDRTDRSATSF